MLNRLSIISGLFLFSALTPLWAQGTVTTTIPDNTPDVVILPSPFDSGSGIKAQENMFKAEGAMLEYGVDVANTAKTFMSQNQTNFNKAIAANSYNDASAILTVSQKTLAQAQAIDAYIFRFSNNVGSPAYNSHMAANGSLAAAQQTLTQMQAAIVPLAIKASAAARADQAAQDQKLAAGLPAQERQLRASAAAQGAAGLAWDNRIVGSLGELSACFAGAAPPTGVNCNVFVGRTLETVYGVSDFKAADGTYLTANQIADFLVTSPKWTIIGTANNQSVLDQAANSAGSSPVIAVWRNPDLAKSGHVVLIGPGPLLFSSAWGLFAPNYAGFSSGTVTARRIGAPLSWAFRKAQTPNVDIYVRQTP